MLVQTKVRVHGKIQIKTTYKWMQIAKLDKNACGFTVQGLQPSTTYTFRVGYVKGGLHWMPMKSKCTLTPTPPAPLLLRPASCTSAAGASAASGVRCGNVVL